MRAYRGPVGALTPTTDLIPIAVESEKLKPAVDFDFVRIMGTP